MANSTLLRIHLPVLALAAIAACAPQSRTVDISAPAMQSLLALPLPEMSAKLRMAQTIARTCPRFALDRDLLDALPIARPDAAARSIEAARARGGIELFTDVEIRSFQARHDVVVGQNDLCAAGDAEIAAQSAISALLVGI